MLPSLTRALALFCAAPIALGLSACAKTVSTSGFKGEQQDVAKTVSNLQADVTAGNEKKLCSNDLSSSLVTKLNAAPGGCEHAVKGQLAEIDGFDVSVQSIQLGGASAHPTATAHVQSVYSGKKRSTTLSLVKEGGKWKISGLGPAGQS
jgi:hypothetical protein